MIIFSYKATSLYKPRVASEGRRLAPIVPIFRPEAGWTGRMVCRQSPVERAQTNGPRSVDPHCRPWLGHCAQCLRRHAASHALFAYGLVRLLLGSFLLAVWRQDILLADVR